MKLATYTVGAGPKRVGVLTDEGLAPLATDDPLEVLVGEGLDALLARGQEAISSGARDGLAGVRLHAPLQPPQMRDAMCFHEHIRNAIGAERFDPRHELFPTFYLTNALSVMGPEDPVPISPTCRQFDYELEVGAVIGPGCANVSPADAGRHVIGYTIFVDWSARDVQADAMALMLGPGKGKDGATTLGPFLVTADELEPHRAGKGFDLAMTVDLNGTRISSGTWASVDWSFEDVVSFASRGTRLAAGEVIGSGTVGLGCLLEHYRVDREHFPGWLGPGDKVTFEVAGIGRMTTTVAPPQEHHPLSTGY